MTRRSLAVPAALTTVAAVLAAQLPGRVGLAVTAAQAAPAVTAGSAVGEPVIRSVTVRPGEPVVRATGSVRLLIDVVARGAEQDGVAVSVEPGPPPSPAAPVTGGASSDSRRPVRHGAGWETWRFHPETELTRWFPSGQWTVTATARNSSGQTATRYATFYLRRATELEGVGVQRTREGAQLAGTLLRVDPRGRVAYRPFAGQTVTVRVRTEGTDKWRTLGTVVTGEDGWFSRRLAGKSGRVWRVDYAGTEHYAPDISADQRLQP